MKRFFRWLGLTLLGTFLFVGLPYLAWGVGADPGFFSDPARSAYAALMTILQGIVTAWIPDLLGQGEGKSTVGRQRWAVPLLQALSIALVLVPSYCGRRGLGVLPSSLGLRLFGAVVAVGGFFLMNWAVAALGRQFSVQVTLQDRHRLVTNGPYRLIRHPRYAGTLALFLGLALLFPTWAGALLFAAEAAVLLWRVHDEEALMAEAFGEEWTAYRSRTRRLIPWIG